MKILIPRKILNGIFNECDKYCDVETGGRIFGFYRKIDSNLYIDVQALIGPGPNARRTSTSLFQDGDYQEKMFRGIEKYYPLIAHLGNWHTHHCNGLQTLSEGDIRTYLKTVNSKNHAQ